MQIETSEIPSDNSKIIWARAALIFIPTIIVGILLAWLGPPRINNGYLRADIAIEALFLAIAYGVLRYCYPKLSFIWCIKGKSRGQILGSLFFSFAIATCFFSTLSYYRFSSYTLTQVGDHYDLTYYYLNSKYFKELGYKNIYEAMLIADKEDNHRLSYIKSYRDLTTYVVVNKQNAFAKEHSIKSNFNDERWKSFKDDVGFFTRQSISGGWDYFFKDHGYNPPPGWTLVGKIFSSTFPLEKAKWITSIDIILMLITFIAIFRVFGAAPGIFVLLFYTTTLSGQWPVLGQALLRFDWLATIGLSMIAYHTCKYRLAGGLIAYAALVRVFPAIFFFPFAVDMIIQLIKNRKLSEENIKFLTGAAIVTVIMLGGSWISFGSNAMIEAKDKILMHGGPDSYSSHRVGLGDALVFQGEKTRPQMNINGGTLGKAEEIRSLLPYLYYIAFIAMLFIAWLMYEQKHPAHYYLPLGVMLLFILTTPQINYYNSRLLLIIAHFLMFRGFRSTIGLVILFAIESYVQAADQNYVRYYATSSTSVGLLIYFLFISSSYLWEIAAPKLKSYYQEKNYKFIASTCGSAILILTLLIPGINFRLNYHIIEDPDEIFHRQVSIPKPQGTSWNAPGNIIFKKNGLMVKLDNISHAQEIELSVDNNDQYSIKIYNGEELLQTLTINITKPMISGLAVKQLGLSSSTTNSGFDRIVIIPVLGDNAYSLGHLSLRG